MNQKALKTLEFDKIIHRLTEHAASVGAKKKCMELVPVTSLWEIERAQTQTADALRRIWQKGSISFGGIRDIRGSIKRLEIGGILGMGELRQIMSLLETAGQVQKYGAHEREDEKADSLDESFEFLDPVPSLCSEIRRCILADDEMADDASSALFSIRRSMRQMNDKVHNTLNAMVNGAVRTYLQDAVITMRDGRYCLPVKAEHRSQVPGMIHDQSATGSTLFIEPMAVVKLNNDFKELLLKEQQEIEKILSELSEKTAAYADQISGDYDVLVELDFIFAKAQMSKQYKCSCPVMNTNNYINIKKGRHPLIDPHKVVPIDIYLGKNFNLLIITGPNTGGKTVSLKTVGLLTLMAQSGLHIPALDHSELAVFDNVFADIGDEQSIEQSLSTFSSHMTNTVSILKEADAHSLILFDEIGAGTDPTEGAALAISILNDLHKRGITTMATTHYSEIKVYALTTDGVENACCEFDVESLRPTYRLLIGIPGKSNAFAISKKLGLPDYIIKDASARMDADDVQFEDLLSDLEHSRITIEKERAEINAYKQEIQQLKDELKTKSDRLDERRDKILRKANEEAAAILKDAKEYADQTIKTMNKHGMTVKELEKQRSAIRDKMNKRQEKLSVQAAKPKAHKAHDISEFKVGTHVRVLSMNLIGTVTAPPSPKGEITVQMGSLSTKTKINNLEILVGYKDPEEAKKAPKGAGGSGKIKMSKAASISHEINLLGLTVDEAVAKLDKYLDDAYISRIPQVRIVHGKGTGALRNGVTAYLRGVPYIKSFRLGEIGEGDTGVTIVDFK